MGKAAHLLTSTNLTPPPKTKSSCECPHSTLLPTTPPPWPCENPFETHAIMTDISLALATAVMSPHSPKISSTQLSAFLSKALPQSRCPQDPGGSHVQHPSLSQKCVFPDFFIRQKFRHLPNQHLLYFRLFHFPIPLLFQPLGTHSFLTSVHSCLYFFLYSASIP